MHKPAQAQMVEYFPHFLDEAHKNGCFILKQPLRSGVEVPSVAIQGKEIFPVYVPADPKLRQFILGLWQLMGLDGQVHSVEGWREQLQKAGYGYKQRNGDIKPYGEATVRRYLSETTYRMWLPIVVKTGKQADNDVDDDGAGSRGIGFARSRAEVKHTAESLRGRVELMNEAADGIARARNAEDGYFSDNPRQVETVRGLTAELQELLIAELASGIARTNEQLAMVLATGEHFVELEGRELTTEQSAKKERLMGYLVRRFVHDLRWHGVPVCANPNGYWLADSTADALKYEKSLRLRAARVEKRASRLDSIGLLWFPEGDRDRQLVAAMLSKWATKPLRVGVSAEELERKRRAAEARGQKSEKEQQREQEAKEDAEGFLKRWSGEYEKVREIVEHANAMSGAGIPLNPGDVLPTKEQHTLVSRFVHARSFVRAVNKVFEHCLPGDNPMSWEKPARGEAKKFKSTVKGAEGVSAQAVLSKAKAADPVPWSVSL